MSLLIGLLTHLAPTFACSVPLFPSMDTPTFTAKATDILIVRCLNADVNGGGKTDGLTLVEVTVLAVVKGDRTTGKTRLGTLAQPMVVGKNYLMASFGGDAFDTGFLVQSDQAVVEVPADFDLKSLMGKTAVAQRRLSSNGRAQVERLLKQLEHEKKTLDQAVLQCGADDLQGAGR